MNKYLIPAVIALVVSGVTGLFFGGSSQSNQVSLSGQSERDIKAVSLKVGSPTTKFSVNSAGTLVAVGTTTPPSTPNVVIDSTGTTTLMLQSSTASRGSCIQMETVTGGTVAITVTGTTISAAATTCE